MTMSDVSTPYDWDLRRFAIFGGVSFLLSLGSALPSSAAPQASGGATDTAAASVKEPETTALPASEAALSDVFDRVVSLRAHKLRGLTAEVASLVLRGNHGGPIVFEAFATPLRGSGDKAYVPISVEIEGPSFLESNQSDMARVEIYAYALGAGQSIGGFFAEVFAVDVREMGEAIWQSGLKYYGHLELPAGEYKLRYLVRNYHSKAASLREYNLSVPSSAELSQPFVSAPLLSQPTGRDGWIPIREGADAGFNYPFASDQEAVSPSARPVLASGRRVEAHLLTYDLNARQPTGSVELLRNGAVVSRVPLEILDRKAASAGEGELLTIAFEVPEAEPGAYDARVLFQAAGVNITSATVATAVAQMVPGNQGMLWTDLRGQLDTPRAAPAAAVATATPQGKTEVRRRGKNREEKKREERTNGLAQAYRRALSHIDSARGSAARSAVLDLEAAVLTDGATDVLRSAELQVAKELADSDIESLIPVIVLHDELYLIYRQRNLYALGANARTLIERLAELYAERGGSEGSRIVAARALASLAGRLQKANLASSSRRLYSRALAHDSSNKAAALGLATSFERYGEYRQAVDVLEDLVEIHPLYGEGLLRLAVNLQRLGLVTRTRELLARALEGQSPDWIRALASQELARSYLVSGELDRAMELLEKSVAEVPAQEATKILLAHIYDRQRQPMKALDILSHVATSEGDSARKIYDGWPRGPLTEVRDKLTEAAQVRTALVARILDVSQPEEGR